MKSLNILFDDVEEQSNSLAAIGPRLQPVKSFSVFDHPICLAHPLRLTASTWLTHIPFGMALIDILQPGVLVELGTFSGVSYSAFCQAVKELRLGTRCYAIDTWEGDAHGGYYGSEVLADLRQHHDLLYGDFSELIQSSFNDALNRFENGSIDLLHIDGLHTYAAVKQDFENWLPKMSQRGVILFHDICVKEADFGVWRLWGELKAQYANFEMTHGYGLGLLAVGSMLPEQLKAFVSTNGDLEAIRQQFYQLGMRVEEQLTREQTIATQQNAIKELENTVAKFRNNPLFRTYHWLKYLGRR